MPSSFFAKRHYPFLKTGSGGGAANKINDYYTNNRVGQVLGTIFVSSSNYFLYADGLMNPGINPEICPETGATLAAVYSLNNEG